MGAARKSFAKASSWKRTKELEKPAPIDVEVQFPAPGGPK